MIRCYSLIFLLLGMIARGQDHIYYLNGQKESGKILEIGIEYLIVQSSDAEFGEGKRQIDKKDILMVEYRNGKLEVFNKPQKNIVYHPEDEKSSVTLHEERKIGNYNMFYVNSLALCNADISFFYERLNENKKLGLGLMAAYNFNQLANIANLQIAILNNCKKNFDVGGFLNIYPAHFKRRTGIHYGLLLKYMDFSFLSVKEQGAGSSSVVSYSASHGYQLATLLNFGLYSSVTGNLFVRSSIALGAYFLHGEYKEQYNQLMKSNNVRTSDASILPKAYLSFCIGYNF